MPRWIESLLVGGIVATLKSYRAPTHSIVRVGIDATWPPLGGGVLHRAQLARKYT